MKISEIIKAMQEALTTQGDLEAVYISDYDEVHPIDFAEVHATPGRWDNEPPVPYFGFN